MGAVNAFVHRFAFALAGRLTFFLHAQKESKQRKRAPYITVDGKKRHRVNSGRHAPRPKGRPYGRSKRLSCRFVIRASQVTAREKLAFGSNSFPLNPLLAPVLSGAEGKLV
ncbi:MAG: hypothetical protein ACJA1I_001879 [Zhongshania marina]